jgi:FAD:protein FMN transferase
VTHVEHIGGIPIVVDVRDEEVYADAAAAAVFEWLREVDARFSTYRADSEISRLNCGELALEGAHRDVRDVLARCEELRVGTRGRFDMRYAGGDAVDPSGLVKGWAVDRAAQLLEERGVRNYAVNAGGDMRVSGRAVPELAWRIGIQHPLRHGAVAAVVETTHLAVATSGEYARGQHVLDPESGRAPSGVLSVTITGPDLATADAYATAAFAMGTAAPDWTARLRGYEAMTILADETVWKTAGFPAA